MSLKIVSEITNIEVIARGRGVREILRLRRTHGQGNWRKMKGLARVQLSTGRIRLAEIHWYEAQGVGKREFKRKRYLD